MTSYIVRSDCCRTRTLIIDFLERKHILGHDEPSGDSKPEVRIFSFFMLRKISLEPAVETVLTKYEYNV
jgi:hypothetical protein